MTRVEVSVDTLPLELFTLVTDFLLGTDLLPFSHVNAALLGELLLCDDEVWRRRVPYTENHHGVSAKERYCCSRSYQFAGNLQGPGGLIIRGGAIALPPSVVEACTHGSFSISLWFAPLLDQLDPYDTHVGGNLLGAQSFQAQSSGRPQYYQQFIHVDHKGNLYCSVTNDKPVVARKMKSERWYHIVLTFTQLDGDEGVQNVYLNGELVDTSTSARHREWLRMSSWQLGGGCGGPRLACEYRWGWYAYRGLIDNFNVRQSVLSRDEVKREHTHGVASGAPVMWSLQRDQKAVTFIGDVKRVRCSRPLEVFAGRHAVQETKRTRHSTGSEQCPPAF